MMGSREWKENSRLLLISSFSMHQSMSRWMREKKKKLVLNWRENFPASRQRYFGFLNVCKSWIYLFYLFCFSFTVSCNFSKSQLTKYTLLWFSKIEVELFKTSEFPFFRNGLDWFLMNPLFTMFFRSSSNLFRDEFFLDNFPFKMLIFTVFVKFVFHLYNWASLILVFKSLFQCGTDILEANKK